MAEGTASVDQLLADAVSKLDSLSKRMDALETTTKDPINDDAAKKADDDDKKDDGISQPKNKIIDDDDDKKDSAKKADDDDDDKKDSAKKADAKKRSDAKKADDDDDDKKDDSKKRSDAKKADDDDDDKKDDDGELEIKHKGKAELKGDRRKDSKKRSDDDDDDRKDSRSDSVSPELLARLGRLEKIIKPLTDEEHEQFANTQARADSIYNGFGKRAPRPLEGEDLIDYRTRLANDLKTYSKVWKSAKLSRLPVETFAIAESQIYADAIEAAQHPVDLGEGELRAVTSIDQNTGLRTTKFYGKESFVKSLGRPGRRLLRIRTDRSAM